MTYIPKEPRKSPERPGPDPSYQTVDYSKVPVGYMKSGVQLWLEVGIEPGPFLMAVFKNDLMTATMTADNINIQYLDEWSKFMMNEMPEGSYGSPEKVQEWKSKISTT